YQGFQARDGWFVIAAGNNRLWQSVCQVADTMDLVDDPRFQTSALRAANQLELKELLEARFKLASAAAWLERFQKAGVPCAPINNYSQALSDPQAMHLELVQAMTLPGGHETQTVGCPVWLDGAPVQV